jgi:O-antigen/teichoic acid export membrane protein
VAGAAVAGVAAYLFQLVGTRVLGSEAYAPIGVLWTLQYLVLSIGLFAVETYVARQTALGRSPRIKALWAYVAVLTATVGVPTLLDRGRLFGDDTLAFPAALAGTAVAYGAFVIVRGRLAGSMRFRAYALVTAAESLVRVLAAALLLLAVASPEWLAWALPLGPASAWLWWRHARRATQSAPDDEADAGTQDPITVAAGSPAAGFLIPVVLANAVSQVLLAAGPLVLVWLGARASAVSIFFVTTTTARIPLVFAFGGLLSRLTSTLARMVEQQRVSELRRLVAGIVLTGTTLALVGAAVSAAIGPEVVEVMFGREFRPTWWLVGGAAGGVVLAAASLALNQVLIALEAETRLLAPWGAALLVAVAVVLLQGGDPVARVTTAFVVAEATAVAALAAVAGCATRTGVRAAGTGRPPSA